MTHIVIVVFVLLTAATAGAHVTVWPQQSQVGAGERYRVRAPTEGQVATTSVELEVPPDVTVTGVLVGAAPYEVRREGHRAEVGEFVCFARNSHEIPLRLYPSKHPLKTSALLAEEQRDRSLRVVAVQIAGEAGDHVPEG